MIIELLVTYYLDLCSVCVGGGSLKSMLSDDLKQPYFSSSVYQVTL